MATGTMLCAVISAGALFAYVFAFSLVIVWDSGTKNKSCYISFEKSALSPGSLLTGNCVIKFCFSPESSSVEPTYLLKKTPQNP